MSLTSNFLIKIQIDLQIDLHNRLVCEYIYLAEFRVRLLHDLAEVPRLEGVAHARAVVDGGVVPRQAFFRRRQRRQGVRNRTLQHARNLG